MTRYKKPDEHKNIRVYIPEYNASASVSKKATKDKKFMKALNEMCRLAYNELAKKSKN